MSPLLRITLTLILVLALAVTGMVMPDRQAILASATGAVLVLLFPIWMVGNKMIKQGLQGAKNPARIDREAKQLIDIISKAFNEDGRAQKHQINQDNHNDQPGNQVREPARKELPHQIVDGPVHEGVIQDVVRPKNAVQRSTSPMLISKLPSVTIMSASFQPTSRCSVTVRLI